MNEVDILMHFYLHFLKFCTVVQWSKQGLEHVASHLKYTVLLR